MQLGLGAAGQPPTQTAIFLEEFWNSYLNNHQRRTQTGSLSQTRKHWGNSVSFSILKASDCLTFRWFVPIIFFFLLRSLSKKKLNLSLYSAWWSAFCPLSSLCLFFCDFSFMFFLFKSWDVINSIISFLANLFLSDVWDRRSRCNSKRN